jgi:hypothetical protein
VEIGADTHSDIHCDRDGAIDIDVDDVLLLFPSPSVLYCIYHFPRSPSLVEFILVV